MHPAVEQEQEEPNLKDWQVVLGAPKLYTSMFLTLKKVLKSLKLQPSCVITVQIVYTNT